MTNSTFALPACIILKSRFLLNFVFKYDSYNLKRVINKKIKKAISMMRGKSPRSDVKMTKKNFRGGHLGFLTGISQSILTKLGTHI